MQPALLRILKTAEDIRSHTAKYAESVPPPRPEGQPERRAHLPPLKLERPGIQLLAKELSGIGLPAPAVRQLLEAFDKRCLQLSQAFSEIYLRGQLGSVHVQGLYQRTVRTWETEILAQVSSRLSKARTDVLKTEPSKPRNSFNNNCLPLLEDYFSEQQFPSRADKLYLAKKSGMTYKQIHVWFQNRRSRSKRSINDVSKGKCKSQKSNETKGSPNDAESSFKPGLQQRSLSDFPTLDGRSSPLNGCLDPPVHAYPTPYPPVINKDPFPCRHGDFSLFAGRIWLRKLPTPSVTEYVPDMDALCSAFAILTINKTEGSIAEKDIHHCLLDPSRPRGGTGLDVTKPYTVRPLRAPLPSLIRRPVLQGSPFSHSMSAAASHNHRFAAPSLAGALQCRSTPTARWHSSPVVRDLVDSSVGQNDLSLSASSHSQLSSPLLLAKNKTMGASAKVKRTSKKKPGDTQAALLISVAGRNSHTVLSTRTTVNSLSSFSPPTLTLPLATPTLGADVSLPSLSSSGDSSVSSETHSPETHIPCEILPPALNAVPSPYPSLKMPPAQNPKDFQSLVFLSDSYQCGTLKCPLDEAFSYDLPSFEPYMCTMDPMSRSSASIYDFF